MGNKQTKKKSSVKAQAKPAVSGGKSLDNVKRVLLLYKASTSFFATCVVSSRLFSIAVCVLFFYGKRSRKIKIH